MKILAKVFLAASLTPFPVEYSSKLSLYDHLADKYDNLNDGIVTEALGINALRKPHYMFAETSLKPAQGLELRFLTSTGGR